MYVLQRPRFSSGRLRIDAADDGGACKAVQCSTVCLPALHNHDSQLEVYSCKGKDGTRSRKPSQRAI